LFTHTNPVKIRRPGDVAGLGAKILEPHRLITPAAPPGINVFVLDPLGWAIGAPVGIEMRIDLALCSRLREEHIDGIGPVTLIVKGVPAEVPTI